MANTVLIVEGDAGLARGMKEALTARGFSADATQDAKGSVELIRQTKPDCVVMSVDLPQGQNGYILCGKIKKDDDLKGIPLLIVGNPDGFTNHKKLKTRADDYLAKPCPPGAVVDPVGKLIGFPAGDADDEALSLTDLIEEDGDKVELQTKEETVQGDSDLDQVDAAFGEASANTAANNNDDDVLVGLEALDEQTPAPKPAPTKINTKSIRAEPPPPPPPSAPGHAARTAAADNSEQKELRSKVSVLTASLSDAESRIAEFESRVNQLEAELAGKVSALESVKSSGGKNDKEVFTLRESVNKKDKEILRLKAELNEKDSELVDLREKENAFDQKASETADQLAELDSQLKTSASRIDQLSAEKKRLEQSVNHAKDEARQAQAQIAELQPELESLRGQVEAAQGAQSELEDLRAKIDEKQREADEARDQVTTQATAFASEMSTLRSRVSELEESNARAEGRVRALAGALKSQRERLREHFAAASALLDETPTNGSEAISIDELAEA